MGYFDASSVFRKGAFRNAAQRRGAGVAGWQGAGRVWLAGLSRAGLSRGRVFGACVGCLGWLSGLARVRGPAQAAGGWSDSKFPREYSML